MGDQRGVDRSGSRHTTLAAITKETASRMHNGKELLMDGVLFDDPNVPDLTSVRYRKS